MRDRSNTPFVYIHLGMPKTATTMLQQFLFGGHSEIYPLGKMPQMQPNPYPLMATQELSRAVQEKNFTISESAIQDLRVRTRAAAENGKISVFSKEGMSGAPANKQGVSADLLKEIFGTCRILLTIREPLSFIEALYFQHLKAYQKEKSNGLNNAFGEAPRYFTIDEWFGAVTQAARTPMTHFAFANNADLYADRFGKDNVKIMIFEQLKAEPEVFFKELCGFLDIDAREAQELCHDRSANVRWTETPINRLKEMQACPEKSAQFQRGDRKERASMLGLEMHDDPAPRARAEMSGELKQNLQDLARDSVRRLERDWHLPLYKYGYQS